MYPFFCWNLVLRTIPNRARHLFFKSPQTVHFWIITLFCRDYWEPDLQLGAWLTEVNMFPFNPLTAIGT